jgi:hypothetical protein
VIPLRAVLLVLIFLLAAPVRSHAQFDTCTPGPTPVVGECDDLNDCTTDVCNPDGSCSHTPVTEQTPCDDNNACTERESCQPDGTCGGGTPILGCVPCQQNDDCLDSDPCTDDVCDLGVCEHSPGGDGNACDDGDPCTVGDRCTDGTCSGRSMSCDDGIGCTDDFCDGGACVHQPDSFVCVAPNECSEAVCQPGVGADAQGCVATGGMLDQTMCTDDGNPCTDDRCSGGTCAHTPVDDPSGCQPLVPSYRLAVFLRAGVDRLVNYLGEVDVGGDTSDSLNGALNEIATDLDATIQVLAGRDAGPAPSGLSIRVSRLTTATTAQQRGRVALTWLRGTPRMAQKFLAAISLGRRHHDMDPPTASELRRNGRILLADTKTLKRDVKNLQRTFSVFQR